jgi:hypothetical protein
MAGLTTSGAKADINSSAEAMVTPIVIDLGKEKRKRIKDLKRGRGKLLDDVARVLEEVRSTLGEEAGGKQLVPIVVVYRKKSRRGRGGLLPLLS